MKKIIRLSTIAALTVMAATGAHAEIASDTVDATVGIVPALALTCTDVSFGVWRIPVRSSASPTTITITQASDTATPGVNTALVSQATTDASWAAHRGECTVIGSGAADGTVADITISGNMNMLFSGADAAATSYIGLDQPATALTGLSADLEAPTTVVINGSTATFHVGGVLTIPGTISAGNYGGYKTTAPATVEVDDGA